MRMSRVYGDAIPLAFGSIIGASILTMSLGNFFELPTGVLSCVFLGTCILCGGLYVASNVRFPTLSREEHLACLAFGVILFLPRLPYLGESPLGYAVNVVCGDDLWHIQETASLAYSARFPPISTFDSGKYLSTYYAPWIAGAAMSWAGLLATVKQAVAVNFFLCQMFLAYATFYASRILFEDPESRKTFILLLVLYGGFDFAYWALGMNWTPTHAEWWARDLGFNLQFSSFFTLALWVPHHVMSALAILYASYLLHRSSRWPTQILGALALLFAIFSSVFVAIGALPLLCWLHLRRRHLRSLPLTLLVFGVLSVPLWWIYLGKGEIGFELFGEFYGDLEAYWRAHERAAFMVFFLILCLELLPLISAAGSAVRITGLPTSPDSRHWVESCDVRELPSLLDRRGIFVVSTLYLLSTYFVAFSGSNNYAMRGAVVPIWALTYLATPTVRTWSTKAFRLSFCALAVVYLSGGLLEYTSFSLRSIDAFRNSDVPFNAAVLAYNEGTHTEITAPLIRGIEQDPFNWYLLEKLRPAPKQNLLSPDKELINTDNSYRITLSKLLRKHDSDPRSGEAMRHN